MKKTINYLKSGLYVLFMAGICGCGVNPNIFNNTTTGPLHPCGIALGKLTPIAVGSNNTDCPAAICTYEGDTSAGFVFVWKSAKALLNSAVQSPQISTPDYKITGIGDPEAVAFDSDSNLYISSSHYGVIYFINFKSLQSQATISNGVATIDVSKLSSFSISGTLPSEATTSYSDTYYSPRGLTFDPDDGKLYVVMEFYTRTYTNSNIPPVNTSAILQITNPASQNPTITSVSNNFADDFNVNTAGQPNDVAQNCLDISYSKAHQCFFLTDLYNQRLHRLSWSKGQSATSTSGNYLAEPHTAIVMPNNQDCLGIGISIDPSSQDSIYCTSSDLTSKCQLNAYAFNQWDNYANFAVGVSSVRVLDAPTTAAAPQFSVGNFVTWGVGIMPFINTSGQTILHGILVADAPQSKVVNFSTP